MRRLLQIAPLAVALIFLITPIFAERLQRTQFVPYNMRADAVKGERSDSTQYKPFSPTRMDEVESVVVLTQDFELPYEWSAGRTYMHVENLGMAHTLIVNGHEVGYSDDPLTPVDYNISKYLNQGVNQIALVVNTPINSGMQDGVAKEQLPSRKKLTDCYLYAQRRRDIHDYSARLYPDSTGMFSRMQIVAIVENGYNFSEELEVGFDIYDPNGKLVDFSTRVVTLEGKSRDSVVFNAYVYNADVNRWSITNPKLYHVTLLTKSSGVVRNYLPMKVAYMDREYRDGELYNFGEKVALKGAEYNATTTKEQSRKEMEVIKRSGVNTLRPSYPQPIWYYDLADELGFFVVEQASVNAITAADDRKIDGALSNDPELVEDFIKRAENSYYRTRNHPSVVAYSMGSESGNGYNFYKMYEWYKGVEPLRPIIYDGVAGEWNSDVLKIE